jgi:hypothetical protein
MILKYVLGDFNGIGTPGVIIAAGTTKNPSTRIFYFMSRQKPVCLEMSSAEISPCVCTAKLRCFGFQRNGSLLCSLLYCGANLVN